MPQRKLALKMLSYGVYIVTSRRGYDLNAMTIRMVSQVSVRPPCVGISVAKRRYSHGFISEGGVFVVNVLAEGQAQLGGHFGLRSGRDFKKLAGVDYTLGEVGAPILADSCAFLECRVINAVDIGNFTLFVGEVVNSAVSTLAPLVYKESDYFC